MAQFPGIPWNLRPDYLALTQRNDPTGIVTAYSKPWKNPMEVEMLTIMKILRDPVSLPPTIRLSCLGE